MTLLFLLPGTRPSSSPSLRFYAHKQTRRSSPAGRRQEFLAYEKFGVVSTTSPSSSAAAPAVARRGSGRCLQGPRATARASRHKKTRSLASAPPPAALLLTGWRGQQREGLSTATMGAEAEIVCRRLAAAAPAVAVGRRRYCSAMRGEPERLLLSLVERAGATVQFDSDYPGEDGTGFLHTPQVKLTLTFEEWILLI